mmetsp:Transcript_3978/g.10840  ORF Transcript_3978/g.10840 Transcript_3978/m.10840 type:complete len:224 (+) Transcript_3978:226-897(+)
MDPGTARERWRETPDRDRARVGNLSTFRDGTRHGQNVTSCTRRFLQTRQEKVKTVARVEWPNRTTRSNSSSVQKAFFYVYRVYVRCSIVVVLSLSLLLSSSSSQQHPPPALVRFVLSHHRHHHHPQHTCLAFFVERVGRILGTKRVSFVFSHFFQGFFARSQQHGNGGRQNGQQSSRHGNANGGIHLAVFIIVIGHNGGIDDLGNVGRHDGGRGGTPLRPTFE